MWRLVWSLVPKKWKSWSSGVTKFIRQLQKTQRPLAHSIQRWWSARSHYYLLTKPSWPSSTVPTSQRRPGSTTLQVCYYYYFVVALSCHMPFVPRASSLEPAAILPAQASSFRLHYFPYYVWCSQYSCLRPRARHEGPEVEQMYSSPLPSSSMLDGGGWSTPRPGRFTPGKDPIPIA